MAGQRIVPCIWFDGRAEEAADLYCHTFPGSRVVGRSHFPSEGGNPAGMEPGTVLAVELELGGRFRLTLLNGGPGVHPGPAVSFFVHVDVPAEADRIYQALVDGGMPLMPIDAYPWSARYAWVQDRFGVSWQVICGRRPESGATFVPALMFAGDQHGRAEEAMRDLASVFPGGTIVSVEKYAPGEGPEETVKHGRFQLAGVDMVAMDSHLAEGLRFDEGVSLQVQCEDQVEIDRYWEALSAGGEKGPCGWLKDRFGLSWQVVPARLKDWMTSDDAAARDRVLRAILSMGKLDVEMLERASGVR